MAETEPMNVDERRKYLHKMKRVYDDALPLSTACKTAILPPTKQLECLRNQTNPFSLRQEIQKRPVLLFPQ